MIGSGKTLQHFLKLVPFQTDSSFYIMEYWFQLFPSNVCSFDKYHGTAHLLMGVLSRSNVGNSLAMPFQFLEICSKYVT